MFATIFSKAIQHNSQTLQFLCRANFIFEKFEAAVSYKVPLVFVSLNFVGLLVSNVYFVSFERKVSNIYIRNTFVIVIFNIIYIYVYNLILTPQL